MELILTEPGQRCNSAPGRKNQQHWKADVEIRPGGFYESEFY
jgi:hypothetical protein